MSEQDQQPDEQTSKVVELFEGGDPMDMIKNNREDRRLRELDEGDEYEFAGRIFEKVKRPIAKLPSKTIVKGRDTTTGQIKHHPEGLMVEYILDQDE